MLLDLARIDKVQGDLWTAPDSYRSKALMATLDGLNRRHGRGTVTLAASGRRQGWGLRAERKSPRYTTSWADILTVRR